MNHSILIDYNFKNFKEFKVLLVLQSSPTNPWAQLQEKELTPSTQTPSFLQGLDRQSFISENVYLIKWSLLELYHQYAIKESDTSLLKAITIYLSHILLQYTLENIHKYMNQYHQRTIRYFYMARIHIR